MSNIRKSDVKNHLSPRFNTKIHLCHRETRPNATAPSLGGPAGAESKANHFLENVTNFSSAGGRTLIAGVTTESIKN